jgi:5'-phosphate synthase pdxT subunit
MIAIGILALQGDFEAHRQALARMEVDTRLVRRPAELRGCDGLVLPGGESTTLTRLIDRVGLREPLTAFARERPLLATCAGLIMLARALDGERDGHGVRPLALVDCVVRRNGYGRQIDSFHGDVDLEPLDGAVAPFPGVFIRAPRIVAVGPQARVIGRRGEEAVAVGQGKILACAFHPELAADTRVHAAFLALARGS